MATPRFIPITLQLLFGDVKAKIAELRNEVAGVGKNIVEVGNKTNTSLNPPSSGTAGKGLKEIGNNADEAKRKYEAFLEKFGNKNPSDTEVKSLNERIKEIAKNSLNAKDAVAAFNRELATNKNLATQVRSAANEKAIRSQLNPTKPAEPQKGVDKVFRGSFDSIGALGKGDIGGFVDRISEVRSELSAAATSAGGFTSALLGVGAGIAVFIGLTLAIGGATLALAKQAEELKLTSAVTGLSIQQLQTYQNAAKITGNSVDSLTDGVLQYRQRAKEALAGNYDLARSFSQLGVDLNTAVTNPSASFESLLDQLQKLPNDVARVNAIQKIFGETNRELTSIIISLTENHGELRNQLRQTGNAMSDQSVKDLSQLNRDYELLKLKIENVAKGALVSLHNATKASNVDVIGAARAVFGLTNEQQKAVPAINATTTAIDGQAGSVNALGNEISALQRISRLQKALGDVIANIADRAKSSKDAVKQFKNELKLNDETFAVANKVKQFSENQKAIQDALDPKKPRSGGGGKAKELTELQQLQKQVNEINKDLSGFRNLTSQEFKLRMELEDKRNIKSELEAIIKLRRTLGEPVAVALPTNQAGIEKEKARLDELRKVKELSGKADVFGPIRDSARLVNDATAEQFQGLDKLLKDSLPQLEPLTVAAALAQNQLYQSLLQTNPQLAEYYLRQAQAADATIRSTQAAEQFSSLRDQLNSQLAQTNNLNAEQTLSLKLQGDAYRDLTDAQRSQLIGLAQQIDQQDAFRAQIEESQRRTEAFANQLRGIFDRLFDGPKAFFDNLKNTLKRTLEQMASDFLTSKILKLLGFNTGGGAAGAGQAGFGGLAPALAGANAGGGPGGGGGIGNAISQAVTGGFNGGGGNAALTGGFSGGNPAGNILNQVTGGGGGGGGFNVGGFNVGGLISKGGGFLGKLFGFGGGATKAASGAVSAAKAAAGVGTQAAGAASAAGSAASSGGFLSSIFGSGGGGAALFSNPVTAIIGGALIAAPFIIGLFKDRTFNRFRNEVKKAYQIEVDKKQEGRSLFQGVEQIGKNVYGKDFKNRIPELIQTRPVKEQIAQYGIATGQDKSSLVREFANKQKVTDPDDPQNQIVRREFGGPVRRGDTVLVGERRPEILVPGSDGFVFPSIAAYERQLIAALQKRAAGGFFGGAFAKLAGQIEAAAFSRSAGGSATAGGGGSDNVMLGVLAELTEAVAGLKAIPAGQMVAQGLRDNPNLASRALATDIRAASPESKQIIKAAKGYK